jgi:hypothetical protein
MADTGFLVGAYASLPPTRPEQADYYRALAEQPWVTGLELPYPGDLAEDVAWISGNLHAGWNTNSVTLIPGTMQNVWRNSGFGLASPDEDGRVAALSFAEDVRRRVHDLTDSVGDGSVAFVQVHSAPTGRASRDAFARSLEELVAGDWAGARLVIEHCDRLIEGRTPEKGFLSLEDEISVALATGVGIHINWGRSCLEERDPEAPERHIRQAAESGVLTGVVFSGASDSPTIYGAAWADGHVPAQSDEPASLMTSERIGSCAAAARQAPELAYLGAKICVPEASTIDERIEMIRGIHRAASGQ